MGLPISWHGRNIHNKYVLGRELTDKETEEMLACKSISKGKLRSVIDIEHVRREINKI